VENHYCQQIFYEITSFFVRRDLKNRKKFYINDTGVGLTILSGGNLSDKVD